MSLTAGIAGYSRSRLSGRFSTTPDRGFGMKALNVTVQSDPPKIPDTHRGSKFAPHGYTGGVEAAPIVVPWLDRGRPLDDVYVELSYLNMIYMRINIPACETLSGLDSALPAYLWFHHKLDS
jgi:hypothetical protein